MKHYPRIYSLSTVGLIHHREFDYLFHSFRTDFIGESGSGKSMIADLIQLIFVGSEEFESATKATDIRDPQGMVLQTDKREKGVGYAFLNIEIGPSQYLVVGSYMETGNRNALSFIVQTGFDWPKINYLTTPLSYKQFLNGDDILSMDQLPDWLEQRGLHLKSWSRPKEYHKILYQQQILPLDLASSDRLLRDYAGILQSFSRGKTLDTQKHDSLKQFLFGNQEAKRMLEQFRNAEKDMAKAIGEYGINLQEIERVTQKQKALLDLRELKIQRDEAQHTWLYKRLLYHYQEKNRIKKDINDHINAYQQAFQHQSILKDLLQDEMRQNEEHLPELRQFLDEAEDVYANILPRYKDVEQVSTLLRELKCNYEELQQRYDAYRQDKALQAALSPFLEKLRRKNLEKEFELIPDKSSVSILNQYITERLQEWKAVICQKQLLKKYINLNDPESLANWALQQKRSFSLEEESAIVHFQMLPRVKTDNKDYLPSPGELLLALPVAEKEQDGFWISLKGIRKYIPFVKEQILNTTDESKIRSYLETHTTTLEKDISQLEKNLRDFQSIQAILAEQDNLTFVLLSYKRKEILLDFQIIPSFEISPERFNEYQKAYVSREVVQREYQLAKEDKTKLNRDLNLAETRQNEYRQILQSMQLNKLSVEVRSVIQEFSSATSETSMYEKENLLKVFVGSTDKPTFLRQRWEQIQPSLTNVANLVLQKEQLNNSEDEFLKAKLQYQQWYENLPESLVSEDYILEPKDENHKYIQAEAKFGEKYSSIIDHYIATESYRFGETKDFVELAKNLLPEAFHNVVVEQSEANVVGIIASYLTRINDKNRQLNNRKIQKIKDLLDEVDELTTHQENTIRRIDNFLKSGAQITGGYTARLHKSAAVNYPKSWMSKFRETLEDEQQSGKLQSRLAEKIDLEGMIKEAFLNSGGALSAAATISKLLDPSSYYELSFKMESESGRINKGSTGQTYAAIALLCISRLSIMSNEEGKPAPPAVRIMPIDEAEGLGSNYDMLYDIAKKYDYQLISLSISPVGKFRDGEQYLYMLHKNMEVEEPINYTPVAILSESDKENVRHV